MSVMRGVEGKSAAIALLVLILAEGAIIVAGSVWVWQSAS